FAAVEARHYREHGAANERVAHTARIRPSRLFDWVRESDEDVAAPPMHGRGDVSPPRDVVVIEQPGDLPVVRSICGWRQPFRHDETRSRALPVVLGNHSGGKIAE